MLICSFNYYIIYYTVVELTWPPWQEAASLMAVDHGILLKLEQLAADSNFSPGILQDLKVVITPAIRILFQAYEEDGYHPRSAGGKHILRGLCLTLPDSKLVEDIHGVLRNGRGNRRNRRQTVHSFQELVTHSGVLATRSIQHKAHVGRDVFLRSFPKTRDTKRKRPGCWFCVLICGSFS